MRKMHKNIKTTLTTSTLIKSSDGELKHTTPKNAAIFFENKS
jgi:hypothetical protein